MASLKWKLAQRLEYIWWQNYLRKKAKSPYLQWKTTYWNDLLSVVTKEFAIEPAQTILDAGCGPAGIFIALKDNPVDAIDPLLEQYKNLEHFQPEEYTWTQFKAIPIELLDETEKYDIIFCINAINHVNDIMRCCKNLAGALKPNGKIVMSTDAHRFSWLKHIFQILPGDMLHPVQKDIEEYEQLLTQQNLVIQKRILYKTEPIFDYYILIADKSSVS